MDNVLDNLFQTFGDGKVVNSKYSELHKIESFMFLLFFLSRSFSALKLKHQETYGACIVQRHPQKTTKESTTTGLL